jgi:hypothetical protein
MRKLFLGVFMVGLTVTNILGQCASWEKSPKKDDLENFHVIYRQALKSQQWDLAFENWQKVFEGAPTADGQRDMQFLDGAEIYKQKFNTATTDAAKADALKKALALYDQAAACYLSGGIACTGENCGAKKAGFIYGRKAYDMYYNFNTPYVETMAAIKKAIELAGNSNEYVIFAPAANIAVWQVENNEMSKDSAVKLYNVLNEIADYQVNNSGSLSAYFTQAKENMNGTFAKIEDKIFDCDYFVEKYRAEYESDANNPDLIKNIIQILKLKNCPAENEFLKQLEEAWKAYASEENAKLKDERAKKLAEFNENNPAYVAKKLNEEGKFGAAIEKYEEAISKETDNNVKAELLFAKASIQFRKLSQYSAARSTALEAARLKSGWGRPYLLIGDMYGKSAGSCGDSWTQRMAVLAAIDKYAYARSIDGSVAGEAGSRIGSYARSLPDQETGFMRGVKEGSSQTVGCWIGETVRVRYK